MASIVFIPMLIFWGQLYLNMLPTFSPSVVGPITTRRRLGSNQNAIGYTKTEIKKVGWAVWGSSVVLGLGLAFLL